MSATFVTGLDLGQLQDFSALVTVQRTPGTDPENPGAVYDVRHLHRWPLGTPYTAVVADLRGWFCTGSLVGSTLVVDGTGVGVGIVEMIKAAGLGARVEAFSITAGLKPGDGTVPKKDLVGAVQATLGTGRLRFVPGMPLTPTLVAELKNFRAKVTADRNETFAAWREADHDDLVLALALAVWFAERHAVDPGCYSADPSEPLLPAWMGELHENTGW